ncbi:serine hydrolase FSH [Hypoxylon trugodes]|uniref:serine hydrolase FSH n=1 Tax=Hypoxylon trugodes TaxID=326681 RepID=UPI002190E73C|nr:serine hydrolase FSH [Hypoxylon trugodes]KAI1383544.1 serine hydrolase FSH [Hypoxylon trugodes]
MESQTAQLRHELEGGHDYEFVEGVLKAPMGEGLEALSSPGQSFYAYYDPKDPSTLFQTIDHLDRYISTEGPFDIVMGFSAGAALAALYILDRQRRGEPSPFKCGIFLSSAVSKAESAFLGLEGGSDNLIRIPTVHIWGSEDSTAPTGGEDLCRLCDPNVRFTVVHDGGHEVPKKQYLIQAVNAIQRGLDLVD